MAITTRVIVSGPIGEIDQICEMATPALAEHVRSQYRNLDFETTALVLLDSDEANEFVTALEIYEAMKEEVGEVIG